MRENAKSENNTNEEENLSQKDLGSIYDNLELTEDTLCGFWIFRGPFLQRFASKKVFVFLYGVVGFLFSASYAYFNGTITTIEKRYRIPSKDMGIILSGYEISSLFASAALSYYAGKGHRPRWISCGLFAIVLFCVLTALPHLLYGSGSNALSLTVEYGSSFDDNITHEVLEKEKQKTLCQKNTLNGIAECEMGEGQLAPLAFLFLAQLIAGAGGCLYYTLGVSYMDDNIQQTKTPALISVSYFMRMLGPSIGYALASFCLKIYISPSLTPTITKDDPRWLGAWWLGWIILILILSIFAFLVGLFPKILPRAAIRRKIIAEKLKRGVVMDCTTESDKPASFADMINTFKRLIKNKILMLNNIAAIFYFFGYMPYWKFTPKYIETQYRQSASVSNLATGTVAIAFAAIGILLSGAVISKYQPTARQMAAWNVFVSLFSVAGIMAYAFLGCSANDMAINMHESIRNDFSMCNVDCHCDYVQYSPVCGSNGKTYISACHAGCTKQDYNNVTGKFFSDCACIEGKWDIILSSDSNNFGTSTPGSCPVECFTEFVLFLTVMCLLNFTGASGRASNFLVSVRCVEEKDKTASIGFSIMLACFFALIPSPIVFGAILDKTCLVWGKTCSGTGNCWMYNAVTLRYYMNIIAAIFVLIGTLFDIGVWYYVKNLKIFDTEINEETEMHKLETKNVEK